MAIRFYSRFLLCSSHFFTNPESWIYVILWDQNKWNETLKKTTRTKWRKNRRFRIWEKVWWALSTLGVKFEGIPWAKWIEIDLLSFFQKWKYQQHGFFVQLMGSPGLTLGHMQHHVLINGIIQNPTTTIDTKTAMKILKSHQAIFYFGVLFQYYIWED